MLKYIGCPQYGVKQKSFHTYKIIFVYPFKCEQLKKTDIKLLFEPYQYLKTI